MRPSPSPTPSFRSRMLHLAACALCLAVLAHCASTHPPTTGAECKSTPASPPVARPPAACSVYPVQSFGDAGPGPACKTLADCPNAGVPGVPFFGPYNGCLAGQCAVDQCLTDTECPTGQACRCNSFQDHVSRCITGCRADTDCGAGFVCSPSYGSCSDVIGFYCHSAADTCAADADCCSGTTSSLSHCAYSPELGHFTCQAAPQACSG